MRPCELKMIKQGTQDWLDMRYRYITASQVPTICGVNPYESIHSLLDEKISKTQKLVDGRKQALFDMGHRTEEHIRAVINARGIHQFQPMVAISTEIPILMASLDGINIDHDFGIDEILEIKYMGNPSKIQEIHRSGIPAYHYYQIQAQLLVTGAIHALYCVSNGQTIDYEVTVEPNRQTFEEIKEKVLEFEIRWRDVASRVSRNVIDIDLRKNLVLVDSLKNVDVTKSDLRFETLRSLKYQKDALDDLYETLKGNIAMDYKDVEKITCMGVTISKIRTQGSYNMNLIKELLIKYGIDIEEFRNESRESQRFSFEKE